MTRDVIHTPQYIVIGMDTNGVFHVFILTMCSSHRMHDSPPPPTEVTTASPSGGGGTNTVWHVHVY